MRTIKEFMRDDFYESLYKPLLSKYVALLDIIRFRYSNRSC